MKHIVILFLAFALQGCGGRQFVPEWDTGYEVTEKSDEIRKDASYFASSFIVGAASAAAGPAAPAVALAGGLVLPVMGENITCSWNKCWRHEPYGDILMSGNVLRGEVFDSVLNSRDKPLLPALNVRTKHTKHQAFQHPGELTLVRYPDSWDFPGDFPIFQESLGLSGGDLVDVYYPHMPDLERKAIVDGLIYPGIVVQIVCKWDDKECFDKFERDTDNFILGRWKTLDEFKAAYKETGGFPNP